MASSRQLLSYPAQYFRPKPPTLQIGEEINHGAYGSVHCGELDGRPVAVKKINNLLLEAARGQGDFDHVLSVFEKECQLLEQVDHPHVIDFRGAFYDGEPMLVMERMRENLRDFLERSKADGLSKQRQLEICLGIVRGLRFLHTRTPPIVHRDLTDKNVMFGKDGLVKIGDLGQSKLKANNAEYFNTAQPGAIPFMSPEAMQESCRYNEKLDIFSLGVLMLEIAIQQPPRVGLAGIGTIPEIQRHGRDVSELDDDHPLRPLILSCLKDEPNERPDIVAIHNQLQAMVEGVETVVTHHTVVGNTTKPEDHNKPKPTYTSITDKEEKKEFFDTPEQAERKVKQIAQYVRDSRYTVMFTGAGISTSTGLPDFSSGMGTVLDTGPGVWELRQKVDLVKAHPSPYLPVQTLPSPTHMALVKLHRVGQVQLTVSQNVDGLHRRSNMDPNQLAELHGNANLEHCKKCGREYMRDFCTRETSDFGDMKTRVFSHETSRNCDNPKCRGQLFDSIVKFGESLPEHELLKAFEGADKADLIIVLGSSLRVTPAAKVPLIVKDRGGKLVICNLQQTPLHGIADVNVHMMTDEFMKLLMAELGVEIPPFKLHRRMRVTTKMDEDGKFGVAVEGVDAHIEAPFSFIAGIVASTEPRGKFAEIAKEPFSFKAPVGSSSIKLQVYFQGHYNEPRLDLDLPRREGRVLYSLNYQPGTASWQYELTPEQ